MKRIALLLIICLTAMGSWAQQDTLVYHPFVEQGKFWRVHSNNWSPTNIMTTYYFAWEKNLFERDGRNYEALYSMTDDGAEQIEGLLREEDGRIYLYNERQGREILLYDFTLDVGDEIDLEVYGNSHFTVTSVDELVVNGERLKSILLTSNDRTEEEDATAINWVEGIGTLCKPIYDDGHVWWEDLAYVWSPTYYLPFTFGVPFAGWRGTDLVRTCEVHGSELNTAEDSLSYEFVPDPARDCYSLHVSGRMWTHCGPNNYVYCVSERGTDIGVERVRLVKEAMQDTDCEGLYMVDFYFPFFPGTTCYVIDNRGEHLVPIHQNEPAAYRPFVEEGKTWKVGWTGNAWEALQLEYYYFEGDTIVDGRTCKVMRCRHECSEQMPFVGGTDPWTEYVGAFYEDNQCVYFVAPGTEAAHLLYDFRSATGDSILVYDHADALVSSQVRALIRSKSANWQKRFKGVYRGVSFKRPIGRDANTGEVIFEDDFVGEDLWIDGIGSSHRPMDNCTLNPGYYYQLMSCTLGDEVLYYNDDIEDGVTPPDEEAKKQRLDFTHVVKPTPRSPRRSRLPETSAAAEPLTGEYSAKMLFVDMRDLVGPYTVTLCGDDGTEFYRKEVETSYTLGLSTALARYGQSSLTLTIENAAEQYVATLLLDDENGIVDINEDGRPTPDTEIVNGKSVNGEWYDLSGRRLSVSSPRSPSTSPSVPSVLPKGVYINGGKKVLVR